MNYMKQLAKILGLGLEEEFYIKGSNCRYKITNDGIYYSYVDSDLWAPIDWIFHELLNGEFEITNNPILDETENLSPILDEVEKRYLSNVIKPFKERVEVIYKGNIYLEDSAEEYIGICIQDQETILPHFEKGTMYKGMEIDKEYTLDELGL